MRGKNVPATPLRAHNGEKIIGVGEDEGQVGPDELRNSAVYLLSLPVRRPTSLFRSDCWGTALRMAHGELMRCLEYVGEAKLADQFARRGAYQVGCWFDHQQTPDTFNRKLALHRPANREPFPLAGTYPAVDYLIAELESNAEMLWTEFHSIVGGNLNEHPKLTEHFHGIQVAIHSALCLSRCGTGAARPQWREDYPSEPPT